MSYTDKELQLATEIAYMQIGQEDIDNYRDYVDSKGYPTLEWLLNNVKSIEEAYDKRFDEKADSNSIKGISRDSAQKFIDDIKDNKSECSKWKIIAVGDQNDETGMYGVLIETSDSEAIVAFRGSESYENQIYLDWIFADVGLLNAEITAQQEDAEEFIKEISRLNKQYSSYVITGHSLGGNLAMHATVTANYSIADRITGCFAFDAPGFSEEYMEKYKVKIARMASKIKHYQWSLVGALLNQLDGENYRTVDVIDAARYNYHYDVLFDKHSTWSIEFYNDNVASAEMGEFERSIGDLSRTIDKYTHGDLKTISDRYSYISEIYENVKHIAEKEKLGILASTALKEMDIPSNLGEYYDAETGELSASLITPIIFDILCNKGETVNNIIVPAIIDCISFRITTIGVSLELTIGYTKAMLDLIIQINEVTGGILYESIEVTKGYLEDLMDFLNKMGMFIHDIYDEAVDVGTEYIENIVDLCDRLADSVKESYELAAEEISDCLLAASEAIDSFTEAAQDPDFWRNFLKNGSFKNDEGTTKYGTAENDELIGKNGDDTLFGMAGDDRLYGREGSDALFGGDGDDVLYGESGNDFLFGGNGDDILYGENGNDLLYGKAGDDYLSGGYGADMLFGGDGNDILYGNNDDDYLCGQEGNDTLYGNEGDDILDGGYGDDILYGVMGNDTYIIAKDEGNDTIFDTNGENIIMFKGIAPEDMSVFYADDNSYDAILTIHTSGETLTIQDFQINSGYRGFMLRFGELDMAIDDLKSPFLNVVASDDSETVYSYYANSTIRALGGDDIVKGSNENETIYGGDGDDTIYGNDGDDIMYGESGDDRLEGGRGNDTYVFAKASGNDTIYDFNGTNTIMFEGIAPEDMSVFFSDINNDAILTITSTGETLKIQSFQLGSIYGNYVLGFDDGGDMALDDLRSPFLNVVASDDSETVYSYYANSTIRALGGDDIVKGSNENETIYGGDGDDTIYGNNGDDIMYGESGNDKLEGGRGNDTYVYAKGYGNDIIYDFDGTNSIILDGIIPEDLTVSFPENSYDAVLTIASTGETLTIQNFRSGSIYRNYILTFSDGSEMTLEEFSESTGYSLSDKLIQANTELLNAIYDNHSFISELTGAINNSIISGAYDLAFANKKKSIIDKVNIQTMILAEYMSSCFTENNIADNMQLYAHADNISELNNILAGSRI